MSTEGSRPAARAWSAWARPISPPSTATAALLDMFCGLNGATDRPRRANARASPATTRDLPTSEPAPWIMIALANRVLRALGSPLLAPRPRGGKALNTPAHLVMGMAAFGPPGDARVTLAALAGGLLPDLSLYLLAGWQLGVAGTSPDVVFREMYYSDAWQAVFAVDNSIPLWGVLLVLGLWGRRPWVVALAGAALLHVGLDLALHADDGRRHLWPLSDWVFASPVSYWDRRHYGGVVGPAEALLTLALAAWVWRRHRSAAARATVAALAAAEAAPFVMWGFVFGT